MGFVRVALDKESLTCYNTKTQWGSKMKLQKFLEEVLRQKHVSNAKGLHEKQVERLLKKHGFKKSTIGKQKLTKQVIRNTEVAKKIKPCVFISQPCGSQSFPDFLVSDEAGRVFYLECKSSKHDKVLWNSGKPKAAGIYIVSSGKHDAQTIVKGDCFWPEKEAGLMFEAFRLMKEIQSEYQAKLKALGSKLSPYCREMYQDTEKVCGHPDRLKRIEIVFDYIGG